MGIDPQILANAAVVVLLALGTIATRWDARNRKQRRLMREMRERDDVLVAYVYKLRRGYHALDATPPELPELLREDDDDDRAT